MNHDEWERHRARQIALACLIFVNLLGAVRSVTHMAPARQCLSPIHQVQQLVSQAFGGSPDQAACR